jgi:hypothetical protein
MSVAWMPHVRHHDKEVMHGKPKVFLADSKYILSPHFDLLKVEVIPRQRHRN